MQKLPDILYISIEKKYHIYRLNNRKIRALFVHIFSKVKKVTKVKRITLSDTLVRDIIQILQRNKIMLFKGKIKNRDTLSYMDWMIFKNYFVYNRNLSDKKSLLTQILSLSRFKKVSTRKNCLNNLWDDSVLYVHCIIKLN